VHQRECRPRETEQRDRPRHETEHVETPPSEFRGGQAHENMQPYLVLDFCIALQGLFPSRN
jgi:microcystin-dependent protein